MNSPIDPTGSSRILGPVRVAAPKPASSPASSSSSTDTSAGDDSVNLTGDALQIHQIAAALAGSPAFDARRVAEVKQAIGSGQYSVDAGAVARKLTRFEQQLGY